MRTYIRNALIVSVVAGLVGVGCSSSDDSASNGGGGTGGTSTGGATQGGSSGKGGTGGGSAGTANAGTANGGTANGGSATSGAAGAIDMAGAGGSVNEGGAAGSGPQACNDLTFSGSSILATHSTGTPPTLTYGTLVPGNYRLTTATSYDTGTGTATYGEVARISVTNQTATIDTVGSVFGNKSEFVIVMSQPSTMEPSSVTLTCSSDFPTYVGQELKTLVQYGVTSTTFSLYEVPLKRLLVYTLEL